MPFYRYSALNSSGSAVDGTVQASTPDEAVQQLARQGFKVRQIISVPGPAVTQAPSSPLSQSRPAVKPQVPSQAQPRQSAPASARSAQQTPSKPQVVRTKKATDKDRFFLFSQMAAQYRAGLNPAQALAQLAQTGSAPMSTALKTMSEAAAEGRPISEVMARYPDLFPDHVVGTTRAGEQGGFLPDAFDIIAGQAENAHKFHKWFWWVWIVAVNSLLSIPMAIWLVRGIWAAWDATWNATGTSGSGDVYRAFGQQLLWPILPLTLGIYAIFWGLRRYLSSNAAEAFRHSLAHRFPVFNKRTRHESLAVFSWSMSKLARAGMSPHRSWTLAAGTVPNSAMRHELEGMGTRLSGAEKLSDIFRQSSLFTEEYVPLVATAEYTGDIPGTLEKLSDVSRVEFETAQNYAKARSGCWGALGCFVTGVICMIIIIWGVYRQAFDKVDYDASEDQSRVVSPPSRGR